MAEKNGPTRPNINALIGVPLLANEGPVPLRMGVDGPVIGTASFHRSEEGETWMTADIPHDLFDKDIQNVSIYVSKEGVSVDPVPTSDFREANLLAYEDELTNPDKKVTRESSDNG